MSHAVLCLLNYICQSLFDIVLQAPGKTMSRALQDAATLATGWHHYPSSELLVCSLLRSGSQVLFALFPANAPLAKRTFVYVWLFHHIVSN